MLESKLKVKTEAATLCGLNFFDTVEECRNRNYAPLPIPGIAEARIYAEKGSKLWESQTWFSSTSLVISGTEKYTQQRVVVFAHLPNLIQYILNPRDPSCNDKFYPGLLDGAKFSDEAFNSLIHIAGGEEVHVIDYEVLKGAKRGSIPVSEALSHPVVVPFFGSKAIAEGYLERFDREIGDMISVQFPDDKQDFPMARTLALRGRYNSLDANTPFNESTRFLALRAF